MLPRHLIALDLDGTLLPKNQEISARTKQALLQAKKAGHLVMIATGRPYRASKRYYNELNLTTPIINFNGAAVHHPLEQQYPRTHETIDLQTSLSLIQICNDIGVKNMMVEINDSFYMTHKAGFLANFLTDGLQPIAVGNLTSLVEHAPTAILVEPETEQIHTLKEALQQTNSETTLQRWWKGDIPILEIAPNHITKATALEKIARYYHVKQEHIIAFGDEENDLEMIHYAGQGIAMANAIPSLKELAAHVTKSNEEDGIALYLETALKL
ncbi:Cof subfamily protein (haloacid dehalogenase superfamily) [Alkalihalobacillus xiaoxiensis]|uniref:Cof subfamily protein (Haloacid dehalogenase superfamily) n=1 Tax=Shouchella xiaoxiensis TaxID=766895 RepID=A0ABS2SY00_9BACI|nr:Cof-type HAD-IIB family hydrolase [Shouchella xiaoxiensis]MBM7840411.1 Cof subfamily protein (haloacid dehalogenase superfamily) [Shouchella xiaoxiensis]